MNEKKNQHNQVPESEENKQNDIQKKAWAIILMAITNITDYRELFDQKETKFEQTDMIAHVKENLKTDHEQKSETHNKDIVKTFWSILCAVNTKDFEWINTLWWGDLVTCDIQDDIGAFIMWYSESVTGHWVRSLGQFGVYKWNKVATSNRYTIRGATASETDHRELSFNEIKILWAKNNKVIIWLQSGQLLSIKEIDIGSHSIRTLKDYDLVQEEKDKENKILKEALEKWLAWENNIQQAKDLISNNYNYSRDVHNVKDSIPFEDFVIIPVNKHNRNYDAMVTSVDLYIYGKDFPEPKKITSHYCEYNRSQFSGKRFFSVWAITTIEQIGNRILKATIEIRSEGSHVANNYIDIRV